MFIPSAGIDAWQKITRQAVRIHGFIKGVFLTLGRGLVNVDVAKFFAALRHNTHGMHLLLVQEVVYLRDIFLGDIMFFFSCRKMFISSDSNIVPALNAWFIKTRVLGFFKGTVRVLGLGLVDNKVAKFMAALTKGSARGLTDKFSTSSS